MYSNATILAAVLNKVLQPLIVTFANSKMQSTAFVQGAENWVRATGLVSGNWSIMSELSPLIQPITGSIVQPMLTKYLANVPDDAIPAMAHNFIDEAIKVGELTILEGYITFEKADLSEIKRLLNINLPHKTGAEGYIVKTEAEDEPIEMEEVA